MTIKISSIKLTGIILFFPFFLKHVSLNLKALNHCNFFSICFNYSVIFHGKQTKIDRFLIIKNLHDMAIIFLKRG